MSNIDYSKKYQKYKNRYLNTKYETNQLGGMCDSKYILLSCPEFNSLVDNLLQKDLDKYKRKISDIEKLNESKATFPENFSDFIDQDYKKFIEDSFVEWKSENFSKIKENKDRLKSEFIRSKTQITSKNFYRGYINWSSYTDNTPNIKMNKNTLVKLKGGKVIFFSYFSFNEPNATSIVSQLLLLNSLNHYGVAEINIILPYFPVGTMERIVGEGEIPTAYSFAHMLNMIPSGASKNNLYVFDIHALCSRFFFHTNTIPVLISMMPNYLTEMRNISTQNSGISIVVFPDDGAKKRFEKLIPKDIITITCSKVRVGDTRIVKITDGLENLFTISGGTKIPKLSQKINLFLIDDLVQTGGTLVETFKGLIPELVDGGYAVDNINCFTVVTHSVFPDTGKTNSFFKATVNVKEKSDHPLNITLITTCSRPLRAAELLKEYGDRVKVLSLTDALHTIFTCEEQNPYISPFSIT